MSLAVTTLYSLLLIIGSSHGDKFTEELLVTPLASGHLSVFFKFTTLIPGNNQNIPNRFITCKV